MKKKIYPPKTTNQSLPKISIVIPSYNKAEYIRYTLESIMSQDYSNLEIIIQDGGSRDGTKEIIKEFGEKNPGFVLLFSEKDKGQLDAINKGLTHANGEIVTWINSDDLLMPGALEAAAQEWKAAPDLALLSAECIRIGPANEFLFWHSVPRQSKWFAERGVIYIDQPGTFWRRNFFKEPKIIDNQLNGLMDQDLWYRIVLGGGRTKHIDKATAAFRYHPKSKTTNIQDVFRKEAAILRKRYCPERHSVPRYAIWVYRIWKFINGAYIRKLWHTYRPGRGIQGYLEEISKTV